MNLSMRKRPAPQGAGLFYLTLFNNQDCFVFFFDIPNNTTMSLMSPAVNMEMTAVTPYAMKAVCHAFISRSFT
jgi:hypothetical protein